MHAIFHLQTGRFARCYGTKERLFKSRSFVPWQSVETHSLEVKYDVHVQQSEQNMKNSYVVWTS
jgi:hypothetical protein